MSVQYRTVQYSTVQYSTGNYCEHRCLICCKSFNCCSFQGKYFWRWNKIPHKKKTFFYRMLSKLLKTYNIWNKPCNYALDLVRTWPPDDTYYHIGSAHNINVLHATLAYLGYTSSIGHLHGDPKFPANIYCKSRNLPNTETHNYSTDLR